MRPIFTCSPFFSPFFLIADFCLFCRKGKSSVLTGQPFFCCPHVHHNLLCWESLLILWRQDNSPSAYPPLHTISTSTMSFPPPLAPGGGGDPGHSGRRGKLYLATQAACATAARRKEDCANVLLFRPNLAPPSTPSNRATHYKNRSDEKLLSEAPPATKFPGERIIFDELTPVAETPFQSSPPVVASPALQQPTRVKLPALL